MKIKLENKKTGEIRKLDTGWAIYLLYPAIFGYFTFSTMISALIYAFPILGIIISLIGLILGIVLTTKKKQFRIWFFNGLIWWIVLLLIIIPILLAFSVLILATFYSEMYILLFFTIIFFIPFIIIIFGIRVALLVYEMKDINAVSLKWYLENGYEIVENHNISDLYIEYIQSKKYPWWARVR